MNIITYEILREIDGVMAWESTGESRCTNKLSEILDFLNEPYEDTFKMFWDLDESVSHILKLIGLEGCKELHKEKKCRVGNYKIFYKTGKIFGITRGRWESNFYDLHQY